ncbi:hypothetical protein JST56_04630 [Candidatus Dependentiae bacterium]|nr:hypothetical protein [Candidatus Dependentiae bacterium]
MKSLKIKSLGLILCCLITPLLSYLSDQEEKKYLEKFRIPQELQLGIDLFLSDSTARTFFVDRPRHQFLPKLGVRKFTAGDRLRWSLGQKELKNNWESQYVPIYRALCADGKITPLALLNKNSFILASDTYWPGYVLKMSKSEWIDFEDNHESRLVRYKNISRVFYNDKLQEFIKQNNAQFLYAVQKYLYHIPGMPRELSDRNYAVVAEKIENLPTSRMSKESFGAMLDYQKLEIKPEFQPMIRELVQATFYTGIADLRPHNIFLIEKDGAQKILIIDTERHGYYDTDENFFHKNAQEIHQSALRGLFNFACYTLCLPERSAYQVVKHLQGLLPPPIKKKKVKTQKEIVAQRKKNSKIKK